MRKVFLLLFVFLFLLTACSAGDSNDAASITEEYINAWADQDKASITSLSCSAWEEDAILAVDGLLSVESKTSDIACEILNEDDVTANVACTGSLDLTYDGEIQSRSLSGRTFSLEKENGQWRVCSFE